MALAEKKEMGVPYLGKGSAWIWGVVVVSFCGLMLVPFVEGQSPPMKKMNGLQFLNGQWSAPKYNSSSALESFGDLVSGTGANTVCYTFCWFQKSINSSGPLYPRSSSPTDEEIVTAINRAHAQGLEVMLRPGIDPDWSIATNQGTWRGEIGEDFSDSQWDEWFSYYESFIVHYARLAEEHQVKHFSVGFEYTIAQKQTQHFRNVVSSIRNVFHGTLNYGANWGSEDRVMWWDAVDYIASDAYYPLCPFTTTPTVEEVKACWKPILGNLKYLSTKFNRTVLFTEIGYCSVAACNISPAHCNSNVPSNGTAQAIMYQAFFDAVYPLDWFQGVFWWAWLSDPNDGGSENNGFTPHGKPASQIILQHYQSSSL